MLRGRAFQDSDTTAADNPIVVNASLARFLFANNDPVGGTIRFGLNPGQHSPPYAVIGVAADVKNSGLAAPADTEYYVVRKKIADPLPTGRRLAGAGFARV